MTLGLMGGGANVICSNKVIFVLKSRSKARQGPITGYLGMTTSSVSRIHIPCEVIIIIGFLLAVAVIVYS